MTLSTTAEPVLRASRSGTPEPTSIDKTRVKRYIATPSKIFLRPGVLICNLLKNSLPDSVSIQYLIKTISPIIKITASHHHEVKKFETPIKTRVARGKFSPA